MHTYAILGATGSTGSELVKLLLQRPDIQLHLYVRSPDRLKSKFPKIASNPKVKIFPGSITDTSLLAGCLSGCDAIFSTVATNSNDPSCSVARTIAHSTVTALEQLRREAGSDWKSPRVIWLSSASVNFPPAAKRVNPVIKMILYRAIWYVYEDLRMAEEYFKAEAPWIPLTRVCPGGLIPEEPQGVTVGPTEQSMTIGYPDLAAGMVMMAEDEKSVGQSWGLASKGLERPDLLFKTNGHRLIFGLLSSYIPGAFKIIQWLGIL